MSLLGEVGRVHDEPVDGRYRARPGYAEVDVDEARIVHCVLPDHGSQLRSQFGKPGEAGSGLLFRRNLGRSGPTYLLVWSRFHRAFDFALFSTGNRGYSVSSPPDRPQEPVHVHGGMGSCETFSLLVSVTKRCEARGLLCATALYLVPNVSKHCDCLRIGVHPR